jgi:hypothetical protein
MVKIIPELTEALDTNSKIIDTSPEQYIINSVVKDLIRTFLNIQSENYVYIGDNQDTIKKLLKKYLIAMKLAIEIIDK